MNRGEKVKDRKDKKQSRKWQLIDTKNAHSQQAALSLARFVDFLTLTYKQNRWTLSNYMTFGGICNADASEGDNEIQRGLTPLELTPMAFHSSTVDYMADPHVRLGHKIQRH